MSRREKIKFWQQKLEIQEWSIIPERIMNEQVVYPKDLELKEFVGISINHDNKTAVLNHTRDLTDFDIVHELLHCKWPETSEDAINHATNIILSNNE